MATLQSQKKAIAKKRSDALYNNQQVIDFKAKKRSKALNNEQSCLAIIQAGKGKEAVKNYCKKAYKGKDASTLRNGETMAQFINRRTKIYYNIAIYQNGVVEAEKAKEAKAVNS